MSESNKFTPGPWFVIEDIRTEYGVEYIAGFNIQTECGDELVGCQGIYGDFGGNRYNANLMAAAPDLLEALDALVKINEDHNKSIQGVIGTPPGWNDSYLDAARKALARARGQK